MVWKLVDTGNEADLVPEQEKSLALELEALAAIYGENEVTVSWQQKTEDGAAKFESSKCAVSVLTEPHGSTRAGTHLIVLSIPKTYPHDPPEVVAYCQSGDHEVIACEAAVAEAYSLDSESLFPIIEAARALLPGTAGVESEDEESPRGRRSEECDSERQRSTLSLVPPKQPLAHEVPAASEGVTSEVSAGDSVALTHIPIIHGEIIVDRRSVFQGHAAFVKSVDEVDAVRQALLMNNKISRATHNIMAYRLKIRKKNTGEKELPSKLKSKKSLIEPDDYTTQQDHDSDGETAAGGRLKHLLQILDVENVMVVVSRWYGGIQLGPDRFKHINNAARQVLESAGAIPENKLHSAKRDPRGKHGKKR